MSDGWRYMEASFSDAGRYSWGSRTTTTNASGSSIGDGLENTILIAEIDSTKNKAADACLNYSTENGGIVYNDYFLPSTDELWAARVALFDYDRGASWVNNWYWTSTETHSNMATAISLQNRITLSGVNNVNMKNSVYQVRCVRRF